MMTVAVCYGRHAAYQGREFTQMSTQVPIIRLAALGFALGAVIVLTGCHPPQANAAAADTPYSRLAGQPAIEALAG
jgi:hypothetical protein